MSAAWERIHDTLRLREAVRVSVSSHDAYGRLARGPVSQGSPLLNEWGWKIGFLHPHSDYVLASGPVRTRNSSTQEDDPRAIGLDTVHDQRQEVDSGRNATTTCAACAPMARRT